MVFNALQVAELLRYMQEADEHLLKILRGEINGEIYTVHDRFGAGHKNRIDIFKESQADCFKFGRQFAFARIISMPEQEVDFSFNPFPNALVAEYFF